MKGTLYVVGVGPGDPEDLTLKAARVLRGCDAAALPGTEPRETLAYRIAVQAVPELADKELLALPTPMTRVAETLREARQKAARTLLAALETGKTVACPVLGDPMIYGSFSQLLPYLAPAGIVPRYVNGIPSFCAAAAALGRPLCEQEESLRLIPGGVYAGSVPESGERLVLMKSGAALPEVLARLRREGRQGAAAVNCGLEGQQLCPDLDAVPEDAGYFTVLLV